MVQRSNYRLQLPNQRKIFGIYALTSLIYTVASADPDPNPRGGGQIPNPNPNDMAPGWSARIPYGRHRLRIRHVRRRLRCVILNSLI